MCRVLGTTWDRYTRLHKYPTLPNGRKYCNTAAIILDTECHCSGMSKFFFFCILAFYLLPTFLPPPPPKLWKTIIPKKECWHAIGLLLRMKNKTCVIHRHGKIILKGATNIRPKQICPTVFFRKEISPDILKIRFNYLSLIGTIDAAIPTLETYRE
jgi:hypothetical protein